MRAAPPPTGAPRVGAPTNGEGGYLTYEKTADWDSGFVTKITPRSIDISGKRLRIVYANAPGFVIKSNETADVWNARVVAQEEEGGIAIVLIDVIYNGFGFRAWRSGTAEQLVGIYDAVDGRCLVDVCMQAEATPSPPPPPPPPPPVPSMGGGSSTTDAAAFIRELMMFTLQSDALDERTAVALMNFLRTLYVGAGGEAPVPTMGGGARTQVDGTPCAFPVDFGGVRYTDCVPYLGSFYCADEYQRWAECDL